MSELAKRALLVLVVALITAVRSAHLLAQERRSPIDALLDYVEKDVRTVVPPEMRPYEIHRLYLRMDGRIERGALGAVGQGVMERLRLELLNDTIGWMDMLVTGPSGSAHVRDEGVYVSIGAVEREAEGALAITFAYFVTTRGRGSEPVVCLEERHVVSRPSPEENARWEVVEVKRLGGC